MDFKKFTIDTRIAIQKLETYGLSCLTPGIKRWDKIPIHSEDIRIYTEPTGWEEMGGIKELCLRPYVHWAFQLNVIHPDNQIIISDDVLVGFIMLPKNHQNTSILSESEIDARFNIYNMRISTFKFCPFKFVPAIQNTYYLLIASQNYKPTIQFKKPTNYDIYYLTAFLQTTGRRYCAHTESIIIPITNDYVYKYMGGMSAVVEKEPSELNMNDCDLTIDKPKLPQPVLPFDKNEFITVTHHPDRVFNWCMDIEQQSQWKKID